MKKLIVLYKEPADVDEFLRHYRETHLPLVKRTPGLIGTALTRVDRTMLGEPGNFLLAELHFADAESFKIAMKSEENRQVGADLARFAEGIATVMTGETLDG